MTTTANLGFPRMGVARELKWAELDDLLARAVKALGSDRLWVNPDCGLKTRAWPETRASLEGLVAAAHRARSAVVS